MLSVTQSTGAGGSNPVSLGSATYDIQGRVKTSTDAGGQSATYTYDNLDNVTRVDYSDGTFSSTDYLFGGLPGRDDGQKRQEDVLRL